MSTKLLKWEDVPNEYIGQCVKRIIQDELPLSKKNIRSALECFFEIIIVEEN